MASGRIFCKCEPTNEKLDIIFHIYLINSEKEEKNDFPRDNSNLNIFSILCVYNKACSSPQFIATSFT
jgi:hypothetical protein